MFLIGFLVGTMIGGVITLVIYACILAGKDTNNNE